MASSQESRFEELFYGYLQTYLDCSKFRQQAEERGEDLEHAFESQEGKEIKEAVTVPETRLRECLLENPGMPLLMRPYVPRDTVVKILKVFLEGLAKEENRQALLDEHWDTWTNEMLDYYDNVIDRLPRLAPLILFRPIERSLIPCIGEALDAYFHGLHRACIALCRTVIESILEEALKRKRRNVWRKEDLEALKRGRSWLSAYISRAKEVGVLNEEAARKARRVQELGNKSVHSGASDLTEEETLSSMCIASEVGRRTELLQK